MLPDTTTSSDTLINSLLAMSPPDDRGHLARACGVSTRAFVDASLSITEHQIGADPGRARAMTVLAEQIAGTIDDAGLIARATYLRAQTHALNAEFETALTLIDRAHATFINAGMAREALRTHIGRIRVLQELGHLSEALRVGQEVLDTLRGAEQNDFEALDMIARAHQNMGVCLELCGRYLEALRAYDTAEQRFGALGLQANLADVANDRGIVYLYLGRGREALDGFEAALRSYAPDQALKRGQTLTNAGNACLLIGDYARALATLEEARAILTPLAAQARKFDLLTDVAEAHLRLNLYDDALRGFQQALGALSGGPHIAHNRARALWGAGAALAGLARWDEAAHALREAIDLFAHDQNAPMQCAALLQLAALEDARGARRAAIAHARAAFDCVSHTNWPLQRAETHLMLARLMLADDLDTAETHIEHAQIHVDALDLPMLRYTCDRIRASCALARRDDRAAEALLIRCVDGVARLRGSVNGDQTRTAFGLDKTSASDDLVRLYLQRGHPGDAERAWLASERAKAQALIASDAGGWIDDDSDDARAISARRNELQTLYSQLLAGGGAHKESDVRARALEREIAAIELRRESRNAKPATAIEPLTGADDLREALGDDVALLAYHVVDGGVQAFIVTPDAVRVVGGSDAALTTVNHVAGLLGRLSMNFDQFSAGPAFFQRHLPRLEQSAKRILSELHDALWRPVEAALAGCDRVVVVPHGVLHQVPFHALFDGARYVIETRTITYAPSATMLRNLTRRKAPTGGGALVVGVADASIPFVENEARAVAEELGTPTVLLNEQATRAAVLARTRNLAHLHLACHGMFRQGNPMFSSLKLHDGWLLAMEAAMLPLTGAHVTLSACESGRSLALAGDEIVGLARAFLTAGAGSLTVSLWLAHDESAAALMRAWHRGLADGKCRARALREAQRAMAAHQPHPYFWAPFALIGL
jgi:tetratricopeptide (TPR) repeat protein